MPRYGRGRGWEPGPGRPRAPATSVAAASTSGLSAAGGGGSGGRAGWRDLTLKRRREVGVLSPTPCRPSRGRACARCPAGGAAAPAERPGSRLSEDARAGTSGAGSGRGSRRRRRRSGPRESPRAFAALGCFPLFPAEAQGRGPRQEVSPGPAGANKRTPLRLSRPRSGTFDLSRLPPSPPTGAACPAERPRPPEPGARWVPAALAPRVADRRLPGLPLTRLQMSSSLND